MCLTTLSRLAMLLLAALVALPPLHAAAPEESEWERTVGRGLQYLRSTQADDGSWSGKQSPGITGLVLTGMLQTGKVDVKNPVVVRRPEIRRGAHQPRGRAHRGQGSEGAAPELRHLCQPDGAHVGQP